MDRRHFLLSCARWTLGGYFGLSFLAGSNAGASGKKSFVQCPRVALIIDDIGYSEKRAQNFLELGLPLTFSVLPRLALSQYLAEKLHDHGHEIMLHQPMEPYNLRNNPGPGAIYMSDPADRVARVVEANIGGIRVATGVNNHMGSRFTSDAGRMDNVLKVVKGWRLFFVDSRTSGKSTGYSVARRLGIPAARRNIFLDNLHNENYVTSQLYKLYLHGLDCGYAVGIGHPFVQTARAIGKFCQKHPDFVKALVPASQILIPA